MPNWKKVIVSGSDAHLSSLKVDNSTVLGNDISIDTVTISGSLIITGSTSSNPTIINPGGDDLAGKVFIVTGSAGISRDLIIGDDLIVEDETQLNKETTIGYNSSQTNSDPSYQLNVTASSASPYSANFDGGIVITGSIVDKDGDIGTAGQVLSSTGTRLDWVAATSGPQGSTGGYDEGLVCLAESWRFFDALRDDGAG